VRLGVEHGSSNSSSSNEENTSGNDDSDSPVGEQWDNVDNSLLVTVREVVISSRHVVESSSSVHLEDSSVEVVLSGVELSAVSGILLSVSSVVSVGGEELSSSEAVSLVKSGESDSGGSILNEDLLGVLGDPVISDGESVIGADDLNVVRSVSSILSLSSRSSGVGVTSSPLEVNVVSNSGVKVLRDEVVLNRGVSLNDVSSLSSDVQVEESSRSGDSRGSLGDLEGVRSILEGSSELRSVDSQLELSGVTVGHVEGGVLSVDSRVSVVVRVNESGIGSGHVGEAILDGGDVVSKTKNADASIVIDAVRKILSLGHRHVVSVSESISSISKVVLSRPGDLNAVGGSNSPSWLLDPSVSIGSASGGTILSGLNGVISDGGIGAISLRLDILRLRLVKIAELLVRSQDGDILPLRRMPVRIVISLLNAFVSVSISIVVLSSENSRSSLRGQSSLLGSISDVKSHVSLSGLAIEIRSKRLVDSISELSISIGGGRIGDVGVGRVGGSSVSNSNEGIVVGGAAHVLDNDIADDLGVVSASMLVGPFDREKRSLIVRHRGSDAISSLSVVLRIEKSVSIVAVRVGLVESIIRSLRVLHVNVASGERNEEQENGKYNLNHL